jgi:predicted nuclease of predicted toxin-antitoxin system
MRFLVDECTGPKVSAWLNEQGHEVFSVYDSARGADDDWVIEKAYTENWLQITNDKDFGEKVYREYRPHRGIVLMRLSDEESANKIAVLSKLIDIHASRLPDQFIVVTETRVRIARL